MSEEEKKQTEENNCYLSDDEKKTIILALVKLPLPLDSPYDNIRRRLVQKLQITAS